MSLKQTCELIAKNKQMMKYQKQSIDLTTANAILTAINSLSLKNQAKVDKIPINKFIDFVWKVIK